MLVSTLPFFTQPFSDHHYCVSYCPSLLICKFHPNPFSEFILIENFSLPLQSKIDLMFVMFIDSGSRGETADHPISTLFPNTQKSLNCQLTTFISFPLTTIPQGSQRRLTWPSFHHTNSNIPIWFVLLYPHFSSNQGAFPSSFQFPAQLPLGFHSPGFFPRHLNLSFISYRNKLFPPNPITS